MKKQFLSLAAIAVSTMINAQAFWTHTTYRGAFAVTDNTNATDWTASWSNFDPENTSYGTPGNTVSSDITSNTTWSGTMLLQNKVYVKNGAVLTIQPGTIIRGDKNSQATLIITRGAKIMAEGTASQPIVFTSNESAGNRAEGDWGGVVLLGKAKNNQPNGVANIEGIAPTADTEFGGNDDLDNSGVLSYVRIEFAGVPLQPNKEINGLTMGSVGSGTRIDHIQISFCGDDSFEWFGGTVDARYLISYKALDDDFDTDFGYRGRVQFGIVIRDPNLSDAAGDSNAFESDNDATGSAATPKTQAIFSNITTIGPKGDGSVSLPTGEKFEKSFRIRRNSAISIYNSITTGWEKGLSIEGSASEGNFTANEAAFAYNTLAGYTPGSAIVTGSQAFYNSILQSKSNDTAATVAQVNWVNAFPPNGAAPDLRLKTGSVTAGNADFSGSVFGNLFLVEMARADETTLQIYPNPCKDVLHLLLPAAPVRVRILDMTGREVKYDTLHAGPDRLTIDVSSVPAGIYFVSVETAQTIKASKLFIAN